MAKVTYADVSAKELRLSVLTGEVDMKQFLVLEEATSFQTKHGIVIKAGIIGASHYLSVFKNDIALHEIFACITAKGPETVAYCGPLGSVEPGIELTLPGMQYSFKVRQGQWKYKERDMYQVAELIKNKSPDTIGLSFVFPGSFGNKLAQTLVWVDFKADITSGLNRVQSKTIHTYPNEDVIVVTEGTIYL